MTINMIAFGSMLRDIKALKLNISFEYNETFLIFVIQ